MTDDEFLKELENAECVVTYKENAKGKREEFEMHYLKDSEDICQVRLSKENGMASIGEDIWGVFCDIHIGEKKFNTFVMEYDHPYLGDYYIGNLSPIAALSLFPKDHKVEVSDGKNAKIEDLSFLKKIVKDLYEKAPKAMEPYTKLRETERQKREEEIKKDAELEYQKEVERSAILEKIAQCEKHIEVDYRSCTKENFKDYARDFDEEIDGFSVQYQKNGKTICTVEFGRELKEIPYVTPKLPIAHVFIDGVGLYDVPRYNCRETSPEKYFENLKDDHNFAFGNIKEETLFCQIFQNAVLDAQKETERELPRWREQEIVKRENDWQKYLIKMKEDEAKKAELKLQREARKAAEKAKKELAKERRRKVEAKPYKEILDKLTEEIKDATVKISEKMKGNTLKGYLLQYQKEGQTIAQAEIDRCYEYRGSYTVEGVDIELKYKENSYSGFVTSREPNYFDSIPMDLQADGVGFLEVDSAPKKIKLLGDEVHDIFSILAEHIEKYEKDKVFEKQKNRQLENIKKGKAKINRGSLSVEQNSQSPKKIIRNILQNIFQKRKQQGE